MTRKLHEIARIQTGITFRSRIEPEKNGNVRVIQMHNLTENHPLNDSGSLVTVSIKSIGTRHFVEPKDLVFRSRGMTTTATIIGAGIDRAVVAAPLLRIRAAVEQVLPEYLCWFINQPSAQAFLDSRATGTAMKVIGKSVLGSLKVPLPTLAAQQKIAALAALSAQEQTLMRKLAKARKNFTNEILMQLATSPETNPKASHNSTRA